MPRSTAPEARTSYISLRSLSTFSRGTGYDARSPSHSITRYFYTYLSWHEVAFGPAEVDPAKYDKATANTNTEYTACQYIRAGSFLVNSGLRNYALSMQVVTGSPSTRGEWVRAPSIVVHKQALGPPEGEHCPDIVISAQFYAGQ